MEQTNRGIPAQDLHKRRSEWSRRGGQAKVPKGFALNRELARKAGKIGGSRTKKLK